MIGARFSALATAALVAAIVAFERIEAPVPTQARVGGFALLAVGALVGGRRQAATGLGAALLLGASGGAGLAEKKHWPEGAVRSGSVVLAGVVVDDADDALAGRHERLVV